MRLGALRGDGIMVAMTGRRRRSCSMRRSRTCRERWTGPGRRTKVALSRLEVDVFFAGEDAPRRLFEALRQAVESVGAVELRVSKSQIAFQRRRAFAWVWMPGTYLRGQAAPLVLTLSLRQRDRSPRWKEIVEPYPGRFTHHLELYSVDDIDDEVRGWLREAWTAAG